MSNGEIEYRKGDMFSDQDMGLGNKMFAHACNCQGVWGSGLAQAFRINFPSAYKSYSQLYQMRAHGPVGGITNLVGKTLVVYDDEWEIDIACLHTSLYYGNLKSPPETILSNTESAIKHLFDDVLFPTPSIEIHSPMINAGLFNVPWELTARVIEGQLDRQNHMVNGKSIKWVVWKL